MTLDMRICMTQCLQASLQTKMKEVNPGQVDMDTVEVATKVVAVAVGTEEVGSEAVGTQVVADQHEEMTIEAVETLVVTDGHEEVDGTPAKEDDIILAFLVPTPMPARLVITVGDPAFTVAEPVEAVDGLLVMEETCELRAGLNIPQVGNPTGKDDERVLAAMDGESLHHLVAAMSLWKKMMRMMILMIEGWR